MTKKKAEPKAKKTTKPKVEVAEVADLVLPSGLHRISVIIQELGCAVNNIDAQQALLDSRVQLLTPNNDVEAGIIRLDYAFNLGEIEIQFDDDKFTIAGE